MPLYRQERRLMRVIPAFPGIAGLQQVFANPGFAEAWNQLGLSLVQQGRFDEAKAQFERALTLNPEYAEAHHNLGDLLAKAGDFEEAMPHLLRACLFNPNLIGPHQSLGAAFAAQGRFNDAVRHYRHALAARPEDAHLHNALATVYKSQGRFDDAVGHYRRAIAIHPSYAEAHYNRAEIKTFQPGDPDLAALELLVEKDRASDADTIFIHFALAKALEDCQEFSRAFDHLQKGNELKRRQICYDESRVEAHFQRIGAVFNRELINRLGNGGDPSTAPIFIVGMPGAGTTLLEQILWGHPEIRRAANRTNLEKSLCDVLGADYSYPDCVTSFDRSTLLRTARAYTNRLRGQVNGVHIVDSNPANLFYVGLIHLIFPNARIIHIARHPLDTCLACYSTLFPAGHEFAYDLAELGRFFSRYVRLMYHWKSVLPEGAILDVHYEDLAGDTGGEARRILDYCGLPWDERCLTAHTNDRRFRPANAVQRWRNFESDLAPLMCELLPKI